MFPFHIWSRHKHWQIMRATILPLALHLKLPDCEVEFESPAANLQHLLYHRANYRYVFSSLFFFITFSSPYFSPLQIHNQSSVLTGRDKTSAASHQACGVPPWLSSQQGTHLFIPAAINDTPVTSCSCSFSSLCWSSSSHMLPSCEMNSTLMTHLCVCVIVSVAIRDR